MTHRLAQIVLLLCIIVVTQASKFSIALISDTHIGNGNGEQTVQRIKHVVKLVNENIEKYNIKWVFHTGDVTDMAYPKTFEEINEILKTLRVHWFPLVGNHDLWPHNTSWISPVVDGDHIFAKVYKNQFSNVPGLFYNNKTTWNPKINQTSWFQNFELKYEDVIFLGLDWVSRIAVPFYRLVLPRGDIHDFPGGTFSWLRQRLQLIREQTRKPKSVILLQHHPFNVPADRQAMTFPKQEKEAIQRLLKEYWNVSENWALFAGHIHRWFEGKAFEEPGWEKFIQRETIATVGTPAALIVSFENSQIQSVHKLV